MTEHDAHSLHGVRVLVTRSRQQAGKLGAELRALGATVIEVPVIAFELLQGGGPLRQARELLPSVNDLVFTSENAARFFLDADAGATAALIRARGESLRVSAVGTATRDAVAAFHVQASVIPSRFDGDALADALIEAGVQGRHVLLPQAQNARPTLASRLTDAGATVYAVPVYGSFVPEYASQGLAEAIEQGLDWLTFTSSDIVRYTVHAAGPQLPALQRVPAASIGPLTSRTLEEHGFAVRVQAQPFTIPALVRTLACAATHKS